jgi:hypothetical protein
MTFTYSQPAFGADRAKQLVATQEAVLKARDCRCLAPAQ